MSVKPQEISCASSGNASGDINVRRILEATSIVSELAVSLRADDPHRSLDGMLMVISAKAVTIAHQSATAMKNTANVPMPPRTQVGDVLDALKEEEGDVELAIKLLSVRFAEADAAGKSLNMYQDEEIGGPSVALHLAIRAVVDARL
jgi:hypothetical protein